MEKKKDERCFIISSELFSNYQTNISLYNISNIEEIINIFKSRLIDLFENNKLFNLSEIVKKTNFHIHSYTIEEILTSSSDDYFYICDHSH